MTTAPDQPPTPPATRAARRPVWWRALAAGPARRALAWWDAGADAVLGSTCGVCGAPGANPCAACRTHTADLEHRRWRCARCAQPSPQAIALCGHCRQHAPAFEHTVCAAPYAPPYEQIALALKFSHRADAATTLGVLLGDAFARTGLPAPDCLIPVPLSRERLAERGYNQSALIARSLAAACGVPLDLDTLRRLVHTPAATQLDRAARAQALHGAFAATRRLEGLRIGLVDDVMTTGATMHAAAQALKAAGAHEVIGLAALRTPLD
jgi:ComF family protein